MGTKKVLKSILNMIEELAVDKAQLQHKLEEVRDQLWTAQDKLALLRAESASCEDALAGEQDMRSALHEECAGLKRRLKNLEEYNARLLARMPFNEAQRLRAEGMGSDVPSNEMVGHIQRD